MPSPSPSNCDDVPVPMSFRVTPPTATAVVGGRHRSLVIVPLSRTVAIIFLVLLLPPERTPILDRDSRPRRAIYGGDGGPALIHARKLSSSSTWRRGRPPSIHPLPPSAPRQHRRHDSRHVQRPLKIACVRTSVLPSFYVLCPLRFFPHRDCDDRTSPVVGVPIPPTPADPDPDGGDAATPEGPNSASSLSRGASD